MIASIIEPDLYLTFSQLNLLFIHLCVCNIGLDALAYDPHKFAMDYHSIGFRECASEVARYLVTVEGMDIQDPLRLRLMSHLQCFAAQRELANKQASVSSWGLNSLTSNHTYPLAPPSHHGLANTGNTGKICLLLHLKGTIVLLFNK